MKVEKKVSVLGEWAKVKVDIFNGDLITIASEGEKVTGEFGERNVFKVETKNGIKNLSFNQTSINYLVDAFGEETNEWQGEKVKVWLVKSNVGGKLRDIVEAIPSALVGGIAFVVPYFVAAYIIGPECASVLGALAGMLIYALILKAGFFNLRRTYILTNSNIPSIIKPSVVPVRENPGEM